MALPFVNGTADGNPDTLANPTTATAAPSSATLGSASVESIIQACGYNSARTVTGIDYLTGDPTVAPLTYPTPLSAIGFANNPMTDAYDLPTTPSIGPDTGLDTASQVESWITGAETTDGSTPRSPNGGWLSLTFHKVCGTTPRHRWLRQAEQIPDGRAQLQLAHELDCAAGASGQHRGQDDATGTNPAGK